MYIVIVSVNTKVNKYTCKSQLGLGNILVFDLQKALIKTLKLIVALVSEKVK